MEKNYYKIAFFISLIFVSLLTGLYLFQLQKKPTNLIPNQSPTVTISQPPVTISQPVITTSSSKKIPLIAYIQNSNVFLRDPNTNSTKQITKNGSIKSLRWSKDGQWLYWFAAYPDANKNEIYSFGRGKYPNFKIDIFLEADKNIFHALVDDMVNRNDIYTFYPLVNRNQLIIGSHDGLYLATLTGNRGANYKQLFEHKPLGGMGDPNIKDSYALVDVDPNEKYMLLSYCTWEMCPDTGYSEIDHPRFISFPRIVGDKNISPGSATFSPSGKYVLLGGGRNDMTGDNPLEIIYSFPSLVTKFDVNSKFAKEIESSIFLNNEIIAIAQEDLTYEEGVPVKVIITIIDINKQEELSHTDITLQNKNGGARLDLISGDSQGLLYKVIGNGPNKYYSIKFNPDFSIKSTNESLSNISNESWYLTQPNSN